MDATIVFHGFIMEVRFISHKSRFVVLFGDGVTPVSYMHCSAAEMYLVFPVRSIRYCSFLHVYLFIIYSYKKNIIINVQILLN